MAEDDARTLALGRIEGKLDTFAYRLDVEQMRGNDHETRLRKLEKLMWAAPPSLVLAIVALILTFTE